MHHALSSGHLSMHHALLSSHVNIHHALSLQLKIKPRSNLKRCLFLLLVNTHNNPKQIYPQQICFQETQISREFCSRWLIPSINSNANLKLKQCCWSLPNSSPLLGFIFTHSTLPADPLPHFQRGLSWHHLHLPHRLSSWSSGRVVHPPSSTRLPACCKPHLSSARPAPLSTPGVFLNAASSMRSPAWGLSRLAVCPSCTPHASVWPAPCLTPGVFLNTSCSVESPACLSRRVSLLNPTSPCSGCYRVYGIFRISLQIFVVACPKLVADAHGVFPLVHPA